MPVGGVWLCVCVVSGVIAESLLFPPVTVNNSKHATEVEQLYLQLELINIEEKMLKLQMLKHRRQRRPAYTAIQTGKSNC